MTTPLSSTSTLFSQAASVFDGWTDPDTGLRVLRIVSPDQPADTPPLHTMYHQFNGFIGDGQKVILRRAWRRSEGEPRPRRGGRRRAQALDLTTGELTQPFPERHHVADVARTGDRAVLVRRDRENDQTTCVLWDLHTQQELARLEIPAPWRMSGCAALSNGRGVLISMMQGKPYDEPVQSRFDVLHDDGTSRQILEADGYFCNHIVSCPTDANLFSYDRWPTPKRPCEQVIYVMTLDGELHEPLKMTEQTGRPGSIWGGQRDHYVWTPDGTRIASYYSPLDVDVSEHFNHFEFGWYISVTDWRTGEDLAAEYPAGRWGCHFQITPDSRYAVSAGGPGFDYLYAIDIEKLREGWNERILCAYPQTVSTGENVGPFAHPTPLRDGSGVLFTAGWPGPEEGVYLVEWPNDL